MKKNHETLATSFHDEGVEPVGGRSRLRANPQVPDCDAVALLRSQISQVHQLLDENVAAAMERARTRPLRRQILSLYAHALCIEDTTVNLLLRAMQPMFKQTWTGGQLEPWDLNSVRAYAEVVHAATDVLLARLTSADLRMAVDLSDAGLGNPDVTWVLNRFILWQTMMTCGEIAAARSQSGRTGVRLRAVPRQDVGASNGRRNGVHQVSPSSPDGVGSAEPSLASS